ncbi:MAG: mechanosensitive ion channel family protein [Thermosynechococcaceae cyanobacterium MS004]|nr:mechanosensitive ion channel family protein [Thermosynechococcaceae cyanobacterium MS004]
MTTRLKLRFVPVALLMIALVMGWSAIAHAQFPSLPTAASNDPHKPPNNVTRLGVYEIAAVRSPLDRKKLFEVVSPTVFNRESPLENSLPVEVRAEEIIQRLNRALDRVLNTQNPPLVTIDTLNNESILQLNSGQANGKISRQTSRPLRLVTVTEPDADYSGKPLEELAKEWQTILQAEVDRIDRLFSPPVLWQRLGQAFQILVGLVLGSLLLWVLRQRVIRRQKLLKARYQADFAAPEISSDLSTVQTAVSPTEPEGALGAQPPVLQGDEADAETMMNLRSRFLVLLQQQFSLKRQMEVYAFLKWMLFWAFILLWYGGIAAITSQVPFLMRWATEATAAPLLLLVLWFLISLALRITKSLIDRLTQVWTTHPYLPLSESQRIALRAATVSGALKGFITFLLMTLGIVWSLSLFNVPTGSILAGGAVVGIAISLGSQSLIKDLVNGCLILAEDQFAVGDVIQVGSKSGLVEHLNLRVTQLRNHEGQLITIPNSNISDVSNLTRLWSRVDFSILVAYENDPLQVLDVLRQVARQLYKEPGWSDRILNPPEVLGIDEISGNGMLMRVWIKTAPMEQWRVGREFRLRVRQAFESHQLQIGHSPKTP